ncbi:hypothetical protein PR048_007146 [Dryococelus australis]|uniref:Uncharacterized protein n=1 Tax=Dryococelus australis TaxID=614101 RepID=A0ABQ9ICU4_9NEOP|nr:hypothetical protein PR048_007146 [Dryococelus australis]
MENYVEVILTLEYLNTTALNASILNTTASKSDVWKGKQTAVSCAQSTAPFKTMALDLTGRYPFYFPLSVCAYLINRYWYAVYWQKLACILHYVPHTNLTERCNQVHTNLATSKMPSTLLQGCKLPCTKS